MVKQNILSLLILCLCTQQSVHGNNLLKQALRDVSYSVSEIINSRLILGGLFVSLTYCAVKSFIKAGRHCAKKEAIQNSIPKLVQYINHLKKRVSKKQMLLGSDWYVYIVYDNVYDNVLNHDSSEYKLIKKYYAREKMYRRRAALSVIAAVLTGAHLQKICAARR